MYEYTPALPKRRERLIAILLLFLGVCLFGFSQVNGIPYPIIYQFLALCALTATIILVSCYLMRHYVYSIVPRDGGSETDAPDFVVTEYYGRRISVVCRVSLDDIEEIVPITKQTKKEIKQKQKGRLFYDYTADLFSQNRYLLLITDGEHCFCARLLADETLLKCLQKT
jgi:hypothetical protein